MKVLWLDDEVVKRTVRKPGVELRCYRTLGKGADYLVRLGVEAVDWVLVDLVLPDGGWGDGRLGRPGVGFVDYLKSQLYVQRVAVWSHVVTPELDATVRLNGADLVFSKRNVSLHGVLEEMQHHMRSPGGGDRA